MIANFRKSLRSWATVGLLLFALIAIVVTGFGTGGVGGLGALTGQGGATGDNVATVGGEAIAAAEVHDTLTRSFTRAQQQQPTLDMASFIAQGAYEQTLNQLIASTAIRLFGEEQGLTVSQRMVDREIVNIPAFRNFTGQFDQNTFRAALAAQNITEAALREDISRSLMQRQLLGPIALGVRVPEGIVRQYTALALERRRGSVGVVPFQLMAQGINPTDADLANFYQRNRAAFTDPERRIIKYAVMGREQVTRNVTPTDAEIQAVYNHNAAVYGAHEARNLQSIVLPTQQAALSFAQRVRGGTDFAAAAAQAGFGAGDINFANQQRAQFATATAGPVADAAFTAAQGAIVGPIRSELGFHVVRVAQISTTPARTLDAVRGEIARAIEQRKRTDALAALIARVEDQLSSGANFDEVARAEHLTVVTTPAVNASGQPGPLPPGQTWTAPPELQPLLRNAFTVDPEQLDPTVEQLVANERFALVGVARVIPAAPPPLAQIRDRVRTAFVQRTALQRARALADSIAARINGGMPAARAYAEAQPRLPAARPVDVQRIQIMRTDQQVPPPLIALFSIPPGKARVVPAANNEGWYIVALEQSIPGNADTQPTLITRIRTDLAGTASEDFAVQFARAVEARSNVQRNQAAIAAARNQAAGIAPR